MLFKELLFVEYPSFGEGISKDLQVITGLQIVRLLYEFFSVWCYRETS